MWKNGRAGSDLDKNLKAVISAGLAKMDLVTRAEFDLQAELPSRTRTARGKTGRVALPLPDI